MKKEMMENATGVKLTKKASKNVIRSLSVGLASNDGIIYSDCSIC